MLCFWSYRGFDGNNNPRSFQHLLFSNLRDSEEPESPHRKKKDAEDEGKKKKEEEEEEGDIDTVNSEERRRD